MEKYIGVKIIKAEPAVRIGSINYLMTEAMPRSAEKREEGYRVTYPDGYVSWSPKDVFEEAYRRITDMTFGLAIEAMKKGLKAQRKGWNGKGQYIELASRISYENTKHEVINAMHKDIGNNAIAFVGTSGVQIGWLASQSDMLAEDWCIVE